MKQEVIGPSSPKQQLMLTQTADTAILGGAMGSGKSYISLLYPLKFADDPHLRGVIFRKTLGEITAQGGLWENACEIYTKIYGNVDELKKQGKKGGIKINIKELKITFPLGGSLKFAYLENSRDLLRHQGAAYTFVLFDEATHFTQEMIEYLIKRTRSARAKHHKQMVLTCNPDPDWFGVDWIKPYLTDDGTPNPEMDGKIRYYVVDDGEYVWADSKEKLEETYGEGPASGIRSFTFVSANCMDNIPLMRADPSYLSNLKAQPFVDVQRYLYGNWYVRPSNSGILKRDWFIESDTEPPHTEIVKTVRSFDWAGTLKDDLNYSPDYSATVRMSKLRDGTYFIHDVRRTRIRAGDWLKWVLEVSADDTNSTDIILPIDPNPAAAWAAQQFAIELSGHGFYVRKFKASGKKIDRSRPFASALLNGGVRILKDCGIDYENDHRDTLNFFYKECDAFDGLRRSGESGHDDMVDCCSDAFSALAMKKTLPSILSGLQAGSITTKSTLPSFS